MVTIVHPQMGRWQIAVVSTFFNTHPFAFRWKNEQGYLDNCGPNGGAMVKCLAIKQFNPVPSVSFIRLINSDSCLNDSDHHQQPLVFKKVIWCIL